MNRVTSYTRPRFFIPRRGRQGMSLLEVLISIFVLSFGLMGVAALLPLGTFQVVESGKSDQAASCARAAFREVKARRMLDPEQWVDANGNPAAYWAYGGNALVIDPLMIADQRAAANLFPLVPSPGIAVPRITLDANPDPQQRLWMGLAAAKRIFTWSDDPNIHRPKDSSLRPQQVFDYAAAGGGGVDVGQGVRRQIQGNYSWMVTVSPAMQYQGGNIMPQPRKRFNVSTAVFFKRDTGANPAGEKPGERLFDVVFRGAGYGGGDVELTPATAPANLGQYLRVRENDWLAMLGVTNANQQILQWYRVAAVADRSGAGSALVTLVGPDWHVMNMQSTQAVLLDSVIEVSTTPVELDNGSFVLGAKAAGWKR